MAVRTITTRLTLDGEKQWKKEMAEINSALKTQASELKAVESQYRENSGSVEALTAKNKLLTSQVEQQEEKVRKLEDAVKDAAVAFGENDTKTDRYRQTLNNARVDLDRLNDALKDNEKELDDARRAADDAAAAVDDFGDKVDDADGKASGFGGGFDGLIGNLDKLKGVLVGGAAIGAVKEIAGSIMDLEENTREYRSIMGSLEISSQQAGYTAEETEETFAQFYDVLGNTEVAATATKNLQSIGAEQEILTKLVDGATGAWVTYGDSINVESLSEGILKTIEIGTVTGQFADILENAGISEEEFNEKLQSTEDKSVRTNMVLQLMAQQGLMDAAQGYRDVSSDIIEANESQRKLDEAWGKMGEAVAPLANGLRNVLGGAISFVADVISGLLDLITNATQALKDWNDEMIEKTGVGMGGMGVGGQFSGTNWNTYDGSHANGLRSVPYDGYVAEMHAGEEILTAKEAREYDGTQETLGRIEAAVMNAVEGGTGPREAVIHVTTVLGGATVDEQIYRCNLRAQERHGEGLVK